MTDSLKLSPEDSKVFVKALLDPPSPNAALQAAVANFEADRKHKSFSGRRPELGKMINCPVCDRRHRSSQVCVPVYARQKLYNVETGEIFFGEPMMASQKTKKGVLGAAQFKGQRLLKHRNARGLQVLERATLLFRRDYKPFIKDEDAAGKAALSRALNEIRAERRTRRKTLLVITKRSRRLNRA